MITNLKELIRLCKDREYHAHHANALTSEWDAVSQWFDNNGIHEFNRDNALAYCDEVIGSHIIVKGMSTKQKKAFEPFGCCYLIKKVVTLNSEHLVLNIHFQEIPERSFFAISSMREIWDAQKRQSIIGVWLYPPQRFFHNDSPSVLLHPADSKLPFLRFPDPKI